MPAAKSRVRDQPADDDLFGSEYAPVRLRASWTTTSLVAFVASLTSRYWLRLVPFEHGWMRHFAVVAAMLALSIAGCITGWLAVRADRSGIARLALVVNAVCLLLAALATLAIFFIFPKYGPPPG